MPDVLFTYDVGERYPISSTTCTCSVADNTTLEYGSARTCTLIFKSPYTYRTMPQLHYHYINSGGEDITLERKTFTRSGTNAYISFVASHDNLPDGERLIITVEPHIYNPNETAIATFVYSNSMTASKCICNVANNTTVDIGVSQTVTLQYKRFYCNSEVPRLRYTYQNGTGNIVELGVEFFRQTGPKTWTITTDFDVGTVPDNRALTVTVLPSIEYIGFTIRNSLINCETSAPDGTYDETELTSITLTCDSLHEFQAIPTIRYTIGLNEYTVQFEKVTDSEYVLDRHFPTQVTIYVTGEAIRKSVINEKYGTIGVYRLTRDELREISGKRWVEVNFDPQTYEGAIVYHITNEKYIDTAKYVVGLFKLPLSLEVGDKEALWFGPWDMEMNCDTVVSDIVTLDFGTVHVAGKYGNAIDYDHTEIEIYLPYVGFTTLKTSDFMDKDVGLKYQINVLNGDTIIILEADGHQITTISCNVAMSVPYQLGQGEHENTDLEPNMTYIVDTPPFINVKTKNAVAPPDSYPYRDTKVYARFGDLSGYTEATEIDFEVLTPYITVTEMEEIKDLLESGVFL